MNIHTYIPTELLRPFIKTYLIIECKDELVNRVLPNTSLVIAFRFKGRVNYVNDNSTAGLPLSVISGLRRSARLIHYEKDSGNILVIFKEAGAAAFFKEPLHELFDESVSLDNFSSRLQTSVVEEKLTEAKNNSQRIATVEQFLLSKLHCTTPDRLISAAIQEIRYAKGAIKIKALADTLCISSDAFEKRFRKIIGTSPKRFSSVVRMTSVISQRKQNQNLSDIAFDAGYFDQSHFNKDFKLFTGQTPIDFFKSPSRW